MYKQTRREFLEQSMLATAAAAALSGAATNPLRAAEESSSPSERLRVAVVGTGGRGGSHLSAASGREDTEVVAVVDVDTAQSQKAADYIEKKTGKRPTMHTDIREVLDDKSINIVTIATPNHWHSLGAIWAVQAGKDVYVEKPVSHNVSEGRRVVQAARKHQRIVQTGTQCRSMGGTVDAIKFIKEGKIGEVKLARGLCYKRRNSIGPRGTYEVPATVDYNLWLGPAPEKPLTRQRFHYDWHWQWDYGNGDLGNQGIHQMDIARWGLGVNDLGNSVISYGGRLGYTDAGETANTQVSIHDYGDKRLVFEVRGLPTDALLEARVGVIFYGTDGMVVLTEYEGGAAFDLQGNKTVTFHAGGDHFGNFIDAVRSRKYEDLHADIEEGHLSSALCHLGNISYRLGGETAAEDVKKSLEGDDEALETFDRIEAHLAANDLKLSDVKLQQGLKLTLDGKAEVFTGEHADAANPMLTREYRKPFEVPTETNV